MCCWLDSDVLWRGALHRDLHPNFPKLSNFFHNARRMHPSLFWLRKYHKSQDSNCVTVHCQLWCAACASAFCCSANTQNQWPINHCAWGNAFFFSYKIAMRLHLLAFHMFVIMKIIVTFLCHWMFTHSRRQIDREKLLPFQIPSRLLVW